MTQTMDSPELCIQKILKKLKKPKTHFMLEICILIVAARELSLAFTRLGDLISLGQILKRAAPIICYYLCKPNPFQKKNSLIFCQSSEFCFCTLKFKKVR